MFKALSKSISFILGFDWVLGKLYVMALFFCFFKEGEACKYLSIYHKFNNHWGFQLFGLSH